MSALVERAAQLRAQGLTPVRALRRLRREFPHHESYDLHTVVGLGPTGRLPLWAELGSPLRPVIAKGSVRRVDEFRRAKT
jgi:hypothetical protein